MSEQKFRDFTHTISSGQVLSGRVAPENLQLFIESGGLATSDQFVPFDTITVSAGGEVSQSFASGAQFFDSGIVQGLTLGFGAGLLVQGAATANDTVILSGGVETVLGLSSGSMVADGGQQIVSGTAEATSVGAGGLQAVSAGRAESTIVGSGGQQYVTEALFGTSADDTIVEAGGLLAVGTGDATSATIGSGGEAVLAGSGAIGGAMIEAGGVLYVAGSVGAGALGGTEVLSGATAVLIGESSLAGLVVEAGGTLVSAAVDVVSLSQVAAGNYVESAAQVMTGGVVALEQRQEIFSGGIAVGAILSGGAQWVDPGGITSGAMLSSGSWELVEVGGKAIGTVLGNAASASVSGGIASGATILAGGTQTVEFGGIAYQSLIESGGLEILDGLNSNPPPQSISAVIDGGSQLLEYPSIASATTLMSGGVQTVSISAHTEGSVLSAGGVEILKGHTSAVDTVISAGGMLVLQGGLADSTTMLAGGTIDIATLAYVSGGSAVLEKNDVLLVSEGGHSVGIQLEGNYTGAVFALGADSAGHTLVTLGQAASTELARLGSDAAQTDPALWQRGAPALAGSGAMAPAMAADRPDWMVPAGGMSLPLDPGFGAPAADFSRG